MNLPREVLEGIERAEREGRVTQGRAPMLPMNTIPAMDWPRAEPGQYLLTIPNWIPPTTNQWAYRHWSVKKKLTDGAETMIAAHRGDIPNATGRRRVSMFVALGPRRRQADRDAYDKIILDVLVRCGLLLDDGCKGMEGRMQVEFQRCSASSTILILTDCPKETGK